MTLPHHGGSYRVLVERDVPMQTRDGVTLRADVYRPDADELFPALVVRTPYDKSVLWAVDGTPAAHLAECHFFPQRGYVTVVQDARGRHASDGAFEPFFHEGADGYDTVEWAATLPGVNGRVGMAGQSYQAIAQYLAAIEQPPSLQAIAPVSAPTAYFENCVWRRGAFELGWILPYFIGLGRDTLARAGVADRRQPEIDRYLVDPGVRFSPLTDREYRHLPLSDWADRLDDAAPYLREILRHGTDGPFWDRVNALRGIDRITVPALHVTSWYDSFLPDPLAMFQALARRAAQGQAREQRLLVGPWSHINYSVPTSGGAGEADFGPAAAITLQEILLEWFDRHLKDIPHVTTPDPVRVFVTGANAWSSHSQWPPACADPIALYLHSHGEANGAAGDGVLSCDQPAAEPADEFRYDPDDPVPTRGGTTLMSLGMAGGVFDQSAIEARTDVLVYTSQPLSTALEIAGPISLVLYASTSGPDTDFTAKLVDVRPDGYAANIADGIVRASFRESLIEPRPVEPGEITEYHIDLWSSCHAFGPGHRVRLEVSSSNFPRYDRNLNTGQSGVDATHFVVAHQIVLHDTERPSHLLLPVKSRGSAEDGDDVHV